LFQQVASGDSDSHLRKPLELAKKKTRRGKRKEKKKREKKKEKNNEEKEQQQFANGALNDTLYRAVSFPGCFQGVERTG